MKVSSQSCSASEQVFRSEVEAVQSWLERCRPHKRPIALASLVMQLEPVSSRFLYRILETMGNHDDELVKLEHEANDSGFVQRMCNQPREAAIAQVLRYVPLLWADNEPAKFLYLKLIPELCEYAHRAGRCLEECSELLSYCSVHPGLELNERAQLKPWAQLVASDLNQSSHQECKNGGGGQQQQQLLSSPTTVLNGHHVIMKNGLPPSLTNGHSAVNNGPPPSMGNGHQHQPLHLNGQTSSNYSIQSNNATVVGRSLVGTGGGINTNNVAIINGSRLEECWMDRAVGGSQGCGQFEPTPSLQSLQVSANGVYPEVLFSDSHSSIGVGSPFNGAFQIGNMNSRVRRSNSLTPPSSGMNQTLLDEESLLCVKQRSMSLSSEHAPVSPQSSSSLASSGSNSECHLEKGRDSFSEPGSGMKDVASWLKKLRLHKYEHLFRKMDFEEMLNLTEEKLDDLRVTKGARQKILKSITELRARQDNLKSLEVIVTDDRDSIKNALLELKKVIETPIRSFQSNLDLESNQLLPDGDLPGQFLRVLRKVCGYLRFGNFRTEDEYFNQCLMLLDKCWAHEAFSEVQKKKLVAWKQEMLQVWRPSQPRRGSDVRHNRGRLNSQPIIGNVGFHDFNMPSSMLTSSVWPNVTARRVSSPFTQYGGGSSNLFGGTGGSGSIGPNQPSISLHHYPNYLNKRGSLQEMTTHAALARTKSAPANPKEISNERNANESNLETVQSVLEHAFRDERY